MGIGFGILLGSGLTILFQKLDDLRKENKELRDENKELKKEINQANDEKY